MEPTQAVFTQGVLSHLDQLQSLSLNLAARQEQSLRQEDDLREKRQILLQLRTERAALQAKVRQQEEEIQALSAEDEEQNRPLRPRTQEALQELRLEDMRSSMQALWFTGISGKKTEQGFCFCLSTAFEGHYLDSYYIQVNNPQKPLVGPHSIPPFIPLAKLSKLHLRTDLKKFLSALFDHLNGFAGRKFQADQLQDTPGPYLRDSLQVNSLHTVLSFSYKVKIDEQDCRFSAKLLYDITGVLPAEVQVTCPENAQEAVSSAHSSLFFDKPLHRALQSLAA